MASPKRNLGQSSQSNAPDVDQQRLMVKVSWLYHKVNMNQGDIAKSCNLSQAGVSRLLLQAEKEGIVRTEVFVPTGLFAELESQLEETYSLKSSFVFDIASDTDETVLVRDLGQLFAGQLALTGLPGEIIGFTSWSRTLRTTANYLRNVKKTNIKYVVEMLGDVGDLDLQHQAALATQRFAEAFEATPIFLRVPGVVESKKIREVLIENDYYVQEAINLLEKIDTALVGLGSCQVTATSNDSDSYFTPEQIASAKKAGAVGEIDLRFIDSEGEPVNTPLNDLVIGITLDQLKRAETRIGVAGGKSKYSIIRAALKGGWINSLATDLDTAKWLIKNA
jgi:DNA-binding transcriptional regulator LsrR (DeoR family)